MKDIKDLTRTELRRIAEEFKAERDAAKADAMRAFDERNILLAQLAALQKHLDEREAYWNP